MADFSAFRPYVLPEVPGCPLIMVDDAIRTACRKFAGDTWIVTADYSFPTVQGVMDYAVVAPAQHEVFGIKAVVIDNSIISPSPVPKSDVLRMAGTDGIPAAYWFDQGKIWLYPAADKVYNVEVAALVRPTFTAISVSDAFVEYRDAIASHAKYRLMLSTGKIWYNPQGAKENYDTYVSLVGQERIRHSTGLVAAPLRAMNDFF